MAGARTSAAPGRQWWTLGVISLAQLMVVLDATIMNIAMPSAQKDLGFSSGDRQWIVTTYALAFGGLLLLGGRLGDRFGRKSAFLIGLVGFAAASAVGGAATSFTMLVIARALQGMFAALLAPSALSLLTTTFTESRQRARAFGVFGAVGGAGSAVGLLLGGVLTEQLSWRWTLYVNLIIAGVAVLGAVLLLPRPQDNARPALDLPGTALVVGGLFALVDGCANAEPHGWASPMTWGLLVTGAVLLACFTWWQTRAVSPLLPLRVLTDRTRAASFLSILIAGAGMFAIFLFLTYYLQQIRHYSPVDNGLAFIPLIAVLVVTSQITTTVLLPRFGPKPLVPAGMMLAAAGMALLTRLGVDSGYLSHVLPSLLLMGIGMGLVLPTSVSLATFGVEERFAGAAAATANTTQQIGGSIGTAVLNTLAAAATSAFAAGRQATPATLAAAAVHGYAAAFWCTACLFVVGAVMAVSLYRPGPVTGQGSAARQPVHI
ncbi:MFS transporter [Streptomyces ferralitis]|uniref:MFS transporter n=2 Tax=Streptantibioticus ferralitis TaxID=236510 RepID=A0ABT5Z415_9ACTN|nr:MFS transporter [Streptantibioticus ferralitis]MDF2258559.1 MFS transporter [Streptantibioticus ferralitis]